jgi:Ca2+-binding RTX toxin-like protein
MANIELRRSDASVDPYAGTVGDNGNIILSPDQAADNLNREGFTWYDSRYGELGGSDTTLTFGFWTAEELARSYYVSQINEDSFFTEGDPETFVPLTEGQVALAREAIGLWDEVIAISIVEGDNAQDSDITFGNSELHPAAGAWAYQPSSNDWIHDIGNEYGFYDLGRISGDVWLNTLEPSNMEPLGFQSYARQTMIHELGHALGLSHSGDYNASDGPATYATDAYFYQDSNQYSTMSYFLARETGAGHIDWDNFSFLLPSTPQVHDILAVQKVYGVDTTTRTGDTVYGFNSTADRDVFDFELNELPVLTIWDAGGNDTLDFSGWDSDSIIDINEGAFSSGGGTGAPTLAEARVALGDPRLNQHQLDGILARNGSPDGMLHDNVAIAYGAKIENAVGGGGNDTIIGNSLDNRISGGGGEDRLTGGAGNDTFIFTVADGADVITDFKSGRDEIDLSAFGGVDAGDVKFKGTTVFVNTDNVKGYDMHIVVQGDAIKMTDIVFG